MSNYEPIIEQNNTELQSNNTDLQGLLDTINALPVAENLDSVLTEQESIIDQIQAALEGKAAGGGAVVETCTVTITQDGIPAYVYYVDGNLSLQSTDSASVIEVLKNNILVTDAMYVEIISGGASYTFMEDETLGRYGVMITGDASIRLLM